MACSDAAHCSMSSCGFTSNASYVWFARCWTRPALRRVTASDIPLLVTVDDALISAMYLRKDWSSCAGYLDLAIPIEGFCLPLVILQTHELRWNELRWIKLRNELQCIKVCCSVRMRSQTVNAVCVLRIACIIACMQVSRYAEVQNVQH